MKVALFHDWLTDFRGGERVFELICEMYPNAHIYTLFYEQGQVSSKIESHPIHSSFLQKIPHVKNFYRKLLPIFPLATSTIKLREEPDLIISSSHCTIKGIKHPSHIPHISYVHSPMRYIYDQFPIYFGKNSPLYQRIAAHIIRPFLKTWDYQSNQNIDVFIANSNFVKKRISDFYHRDAYVVNPFVDLQEFEVYKKSASQKKDYFIVLSALAPNKRIDIAILAAIKSKKKLIVIGKGQEEKRLKEMAKSYPNIIFLGHCSREKVLILLSEAKALIFPGVEDFGITPLESMASGTPVLAYAKGGVLETLNSKTASFFSTPSPDDLSILMKNFNERNYKHQDLIHAAYKYSKQNFRNQLEAIIEKTLKVKSQGLNFSEHLK